MTRTRRRLVLLGFGSALALVVGELGARLVEHFGGGGAGDGSTFSAPLVHDDPGLGWSPIPGARVRHRSGEYDVTYVLGPDAVRERARALADEASREVWLLGDSFVFGYGVEAEQAIAARLDRALGDRAVREGGAPGYGTDQCLLLLERWLAAAGGASTAAAPAQLVVYAFFIDHPVRNAATHYSGRPKPGFVLEDGELRERRFDPRAESGEDDAREARHRGGAVGALKRGLREHSAAWRLLRRALGRSVRQQLAADPWPEYDPEHPAWRLTRRLIARLRDRAEDSGRDFLLLLVPERRHVESDELDHHRRLVLDACAEDGVATLDLTDALRNARAEGAPPLYYPRDGHWTPEGHRVAAAALAGRIRGGSAPAVPRTR